LCPRWAVRRLWGLDGPVRTTLVEGRGGGKLLAAGMSV
jgi:hypothetical protein